MSRLVLLLLYLTGAATFGLAERRGLAEVLRGVGLPAAAFGLLSAALLIFAQAGGLHRSLYPYAAWPMYTDPNPSRTVWDVVARRASGSEETLTPARILRGPDPRPLMGHFYLYSEIADTSSDPTRRLEAAANARALAAALARLDRERNVGDPITAVRIHRCDLRGRPPWGREDIVCEGEARMTFEFSDLAGERAGAP